MVEYVRELTHIRCSECGAFNAIPTSRDCEVCNHYLGLYARLTHARVNTQNMPEVAYSRALSPAECQQLSQNPWGLFKPHKRLVHVPENKHG